MAPVQRVSDHLYEICRPVGRPTVELVFFHGLQREDNLDQAHVSTWCSRGEKPELWLPWLADEFVGARIVSVSYDAALKETHTQGIMDSFQTSENLMQNLVHTRNGVGQDGCPVVLVGHSLGCLVIKEVLARANSEAGRRLPGVQSFLDNVRGIFSYSCPHNGANLPKHRQKGSVFKYLAILNEQVSRLNHEFEALRRKSKWKTAGVTEGYKTLLGSFEGFIVPEASARHDLDDSLYTIPADHFDVCRPTEKTCSGFQKLQGFIDTVLREDRHRHAGKKNLLKSTVGVQTVVDSLKGELHRGNRRLAIVGMGGIGKTTVARELFDTIGNDFDYVCFVVDVKVKMKDDKTKKKLQELIIQNLVFRGRKVDEGTFHWETLQRKKVLIILDDVDKENHVMVSEDQFSEQSCLITTSREMHGFFRKQDFKFHKMETLNSDDGEKLLCSHAFGQGAVPRHLEKWVKLFVEKCGNLPVALTAVGGYFYNRAGDEELWKEAYRKVKEAKSIDGAREDPLWSILEFSYDALADDEVDMFLDIATIFHGESLKSAGLIWGAYLSSGKLTLQNLVDKCLINVKNDVAGKPTIFMHELYRDLGRRKANPDPNDVATHTRVFEEETFSKLLEKKQEDAAIKVLCYSNKWKIPSKSSWDMRRWENLRVVWTRDEVPTELSQMKFPPRLQAARVCKARYDTIQNIVRVKSLRCLILYEPIYPIQWLPRLLSKLTELKYLEINNSGAPLPRRFGSLGVLLKSPELFASIRLEVLKLKGCHHLRDLPDSFRHCSALSHLVIRDCARFTKLPQSLGQLSALSKLTICKCKRLTELPESLGQLSALSKLTICECKRLTELPESLGQLSALSHLKIGLCESLTKLPESLGQLSALLELEIGWCESLTELPESLGQLSALSELFICECESLTELPESLGQLSALSQLGIGQCESLTKLPESLGQLSALSQLTIGECESLTKLPESLGQLSVLLDFKILWCESLTELPESLGQLSALLKLHICSCHSLTELPESLGQLSALSQLEIDKCESLTKLPESLGQLSALLELDIWGCHSLTELPESLGQLSALLELKIRWCESLTELPESLGQLSALLKLRICSCHSLTELPESLGQLSALSLLEIDECLTKFPESLGQLSALSRLEIGEITKLPEFLGQLSTLLELQI